MEEFETFLAYKSDLSPHTIRSYKVAFNSFTTYFFNVKTVKDIEGLSRNDFQGYKSFLESKMKASSANANLRPISCFLYWLEEHEYISVSVAPKIQWLKEKHKADFVPTEEEYKELLRVCKEAGDEESYVMIRVMFELGLRIAEVSILSPEMIFDGVLTIKGKGEKEREIPIKDDLIEVINRLFEKNKQSFLFVSLRGKNQISTTSIYVRFKKIVELSNISEARKEKISPHKGRHRFITQVIEQSGDIKLAQYLSGHTSIVVTQRYAHPSVKYSSSVLAKI